MDLVLLLHIYQPPTQFPEVVDAVTRKSYLPILEIIRKFPRLRITLNVPTALLVQLSGDCFGELLSGVQSGQIELTGTAAYHPLLFKLPQEEVQRQIVLNDEAGRRFFGDLWNPKGFFPPEMAVDATALRMIEECGYEWVALENDFAPPSSKSVARWSDGHLKIVFRDRRLSLGVAFGRIKTFGELFRRFEARSPADFGLIACDGETFGWHRPEQLSLLEGIARAAEEGLIRLRTVSEAVARAAVCDPVAVERTSWGERRMVGGRVYYPRWEDPDNEIHQMQWELTNLAIDVVRNSRFSIPDPEAAEDGLNPETQAWIKARHLLDRALHSDQYWWAEGKKVWHPEMVRKGAEMLRGAISLVPEVSVAVKEAAQELYDKIMTRGEELYGSGTRS